ncbi:CENP-Q, a CENPA-CAD centromere complex subunit-domain-containing protein [Hypoxylon sp. FL1857]|nr:CENP-Q, a CENPA-CAD centromere complex subunit-domain-containing protein [Hypoxylon sp. FL1857]
MAPEIANQKRKRGRPTNASRGEDDASGNQLTLTRQGQLAATSENTREPDMEESARPRKRGRRANAEVPSQAEPEPEASQPQRPKKKRRRSPAPQANGDREDVGEEEPETAPTERRKRGRPRVSDTNGDAEVGEKSRPDAVAEKALPKKRGRPTKEAEAAKNNEPEADEADDENEGNSSLLRRSGRIRRSPSSLNKGAQETTKPTGEQSSKGQKQKERKKGRPPQNEQPDDEAEQESIPQPKKKRGRPSLNNQPSADVEANRESQSQPKKRGRPSLEENGTSSAKEKRKKSREQPSQEHEEPAQDERRGRGKPRHSNQSPPTARRHRRSSGTQTRSSSPDSDGSPPRYRHLTTRTRRVPLNVVESKWTPLEAPAITSVTTLLQSASRPVLLRLNNAQKHSQAQAALNAVANRLRSKISRGLPFPPATTSTRREEEFEFERTISGIQSLESQLDPLLHSVELLRREKERAQKELDHEYKLLSRLGSNARAEARERRERVRKMHVLVPEKPAEAKVDSVGELVPAEEGSGRVFSDLQDEELVGLAGQIANHMESMRGNLQQIDGVVPAITKSQGLLRAALQSRLDPEQLESVILG